MKYRAIIASFLLAVLAGSSAAFGQPVDTVRPPVILSVDGTLQVPWTAPRDAGVVVQILDAQGRPSRTLEAGRMTAGAHTTTIDGKTLAPGTYKLRIGIEPAAAADMTFGVNGMLGAITKKLMFRGERKFALDAKGADAKSVTVQVEGEAWAAAPDLAAPGNTFQFDSVTGTLQLNPAAPLDEGAEVRVTYPAGNVFENPWLLCTAPDGSLYIGDAKAAPGKSLLFKVDAAGKPVPDFGAAGILELPARDIAADRDGNLYILTGGHHVAVYDAKGQPKYNVAGYINPYREGEHLYEGGYWNMSIAVNRDKRAVVVLANNSNIVYDVTKPKFEGYLALQTAKDGSISPPLYGKQWGPCVAMLGDVFYQTTCWNSLVKYRFDPATKKFTTVWSTPVREDVTSPTGPDHLYHGLGVALDGSGLIYVADRVNHRIQIFFDAGDAFKWVGSIGSAGSDVAKTQMMAPHALAMAPDAKSLYVAEDGAFYPVTQNIFVKGQARVTRLNLGFRETIEVPLEVK